MTRRPFDLARDELLRVVLVRLSDDEHVVQFTLHHIIVDDWSVALLIKGIAACWQAAMRGVPMPDMSPAMQYGDFAVQQREAADGDALARHLRYWEAQLRNLPILQLPTDRPRLPVQAHHGAKQFLPIDRSLTAQLRAVGVEEGASLFMTLLAAFHVLLMRHTGQHDIAMGVPTAGRPRRELDTTIGYFVNALVIRTRAEGNPSFRDLLGSVRRTALDAYGHQDAPFEQVVQRVQPDRDPSHQPLFQVMLLHLQRASTAPALPGVDATAIVTARSTTNLDLALVVTEEYEGLRLSIEYDTDLFDASTIDRLKSRLYGLLEAIAADPDRRIDDLPISTAEDLSRIETWNATKAECEWDASIGRLFDEQVRRTPDAVAVVDGARQVTWRQLRRRSGALANRLIEAGASAESLVGLHLERSLESIVAMLATVRIGAAFVPFDPSHPDERLRELASHAGVVAVLTSGGKPWSAGGPPAIDVDQATVNAGRARRAGRTGRTVRTPVPAAYPATAESAVYVMYTSGSTGARKAIVAPARGIVNRLSWMARYAPVEADEVCCHRTSTSFVDSICEVFGPLLAGTRLVVMRDSDVRNVETFAERLAREEVTRVTMVPTQLRAVLDTMRERAGTLGALRMVVSSGEALAVSDVMRFRQALSTTRLLNLYGSSEVAADVTYWEAPRAGLDVSEAPIGRPIQNTRITLIDERGRMVPPGARGEIAVGGDGLARGYLHAPALTAERFVPDPHGRQPGTRRFRTGDVATLGADDQLRYGGRIDTQVKLRGHRIDPNEIESTLAQYPGVGDVAVVLSERRQQLLAYYVAASDAGVTDASLLAFLRRRLPDHMIPARLVRLDAMPLTLTGKINRLALPAPPPLVDQTAGPRTNLETRIAAIWSETLGIENVGIHQNFFAVGGHSLLAAEAVHRLGTSLGRTIPLRWLFEAPTVADLADRLEREAPESSTPAWLPAVAPDPARRYEPFPLTDMQQAYWAGRSTAVALGNVSIHGYTEFEGDLDVERFAEVWRRLVARHDMLRAVVLPGGRQQVLETAPRYDIAVHDLRGLSDEQIDAAIVARRAAMSHQVLPLEQWPAFDIQASILKDGIVRLHISIDTFFLDGWSQELLLRDVLDGYADPGRLVSPSNAGLSFRDYVLALAALPGTASYQQALDEWRARFATLAPHPDLPLAREPESIARTEFRTLATRLDAQTAQRLHERARDAGLTLPNILLAAYAAILGRWSASARFTINVPTFNRLPVHPDVNELAGPFADFAIAEFDTAADATLDQLARRARQQMAWALDHQVISGVRLTRELAQRDGFRLSLPVVFTSLGFELQRDARPAESLPRLRGVYAVRQTPQVWLDNRVAFGDGEELAIEWDAVDALFPEGMVDDMFTEYCAIVERMANVAEVWHDVDAVRPPAAQRTLMAAMNDTAAPEHIERLEQAVLTQIHAHPEAIAVIGADATLTYAEVGARAAGVAAALRAAGVEPGALVGVALDGGWEPVVAVLGVLLAGGVYVPVDPDAPGDRLARLLADAAAVVTRGAPRWTWPAEGPAEGPAERPAIDIDRCPPAPLPGPAVEPGDAEALAYVIYTSGSTGQPKGVMMTHRAAMNTLRDITARFAIGPGDRVLAVSALSFDLSVYDIFGGLGAGATVVMPPPGARRDPRGLWELAAATGVTVWNSVPAILGLVVEYGATVRNATGRDGLRTLRLAMVSGDWVPLALPAAVRALAPACEVVSLGGATEVAIWSVVHPIARIDPDWTSIPYGRPLTNQRVYVLNDALQLCPVWVPGELYLGGVGLAVGYWGDSERTASRFITHPRTGERLYRTGDRARYRPEGTLELLGRVDTQVKLHGHRIEPGEIEAVLLQHPHVHAAVVAPQQTAAGHRYLAAYVVPRAREAAPAARPAQSPDAWEKLQWRMSQPGLRRLADTCERIALAGPPLSGTEHLARRSHRRFRAEPLSPDACAALLSCLRQYQVDGFPLAKYRYGSAGNLYPVQTYLYLKPRAVDGMESGYYYYDPRAHQLVRISTGSPLEARRFGAVNEHVFEAAGFAIFLIAQLEAIRPVYGEDSTRFAALEAGLMTQLLETTAATSGIGLCQVGGFDSDGLSAALALDPGHLLLHTIVGGPACEDAASWSAFRTDATTAAAPAAPAAPAAAPASDEVLSDAALLDELRAAARAALPHYMVPTVFVTLARLPLNANGKVDRSQLPAVAGVTVRARETGVGAPLVDVLAEMWTRVLSVDGIREDDNFFEQGGSSLTAISLATMIRDVFGVTIPITRFLEAPTLAGLAALIEDVRGGASRGGAADGDGLLPLSAPDPASRYEPFPLTEIQQAYAIGRTGPVPLGGVGTHSYAEFEFDDLDVDRLTAAIARLVARHDMMRAIVRSDGLQQILREVPQCRIPCADLRGLTATEVDAAISATRARMSHQVFRADTWPLFELFVHRLDEGYRLHLSVDLLMIDGGSFRILSNELRTLYANQDDDTLTPLAFSFRDYVMAARALEGSRPFARARQVPARSARRSAVASGAPAPGKSFARASARLHAAQRLDGSGAVAPAEGRSRFSPRDAVGASLHRIRARARRVERHAALHVESDDVRPVAGASRRVAPDRRLHDDDAARGTDGGAGFRGGRERDPASDVERSRTPDVQRRTHRARTGASAWAHRQRAQPGRVHQPPDVSRGRSTSAIAARTHRLQRVANAAGPARSPGERVCRRVDL